MESAARFLGLPVDNRLPNPPDITDPLAVFVAPRGVPCLGFGFSVPNPAPVPLYLRGLDSSTADNGLVLKGVPVWLLAGVEGEAPPIRETLAPDRGVTFPLSFAGVGDRKPSF